MNRKLFPKTNRLLTRNEFVFVFQQSKYIKKKGITLFSCFNQLGYPRIGLAISKKYIKRAHERNRIKRYVRETFRINQHNLLASDFVLTVNSKDIIYLQNKYLIKELEEIWQFYQR